MSPSVNRPSESPFPAKPTPSATSESPPAEAAKTEATPSSVTRQHPIAPPSHPKQYRAIGLIYGQYHPSEEQITRGVLTTEDQTVIDAVLLGRVMSLVKKHLDLSQPHLWVVYPRTRQDDDQLHVQIVGVWEPETLAPAAEAGEIAAPASNLASDENGNFSIRGEVIFYSEEKENIIVKIRQSGRKENEKAKFFKLKLQGKLEERPVGRFWDLEVQLEKNILKVKSGTDLGFARRRLGKSAKPRRLPRKPDSRLGTQERKKPLQLPKKPLPKLQKKNKPSS